MENSYLKEHVQKRLRSAGVISNNEVVQKSGDLFVAVNVLTQERRVVTFDNSILEDTGTSSSRVLKG